MTAWSEQRLFLESFQVIHLVLNDELEHGWAVRGVGRRYGDSWGQDRPTYYSELQRAEALDVASAELVRYLEL